MRFRLNPCRRAILLMTALSVAAPLPAPAAPAVRELRIGVAVAPSFKTVPDWKQEFERRLSYASRIFESEFKIRFRPVAYWDWKPRDETLEMSSLIDDLNGTYPLGETDIVIGLMRLKHVPDPEQVKDLHVIGRARPFSGYLVLRYPVNKLYKVQEETVMVHELGHMFGAIHANAANSIMAPVVDRQLPSAFDPQNHEIIMLTREMNFRKGTSMLDQRTVQALLGSYLKLAVQDQPFEFYYALGVFYLYLGQTQDTVKAWKAAITKDERNPQVHYDLGVLYSKIGSVDEAIRELGTAVSGFSMPSQDQNKASALNILGGAHYQKGNFLAAYDAWSRAAAIQPNNADIKLNLALVQMKRGQVDEAIRVFRRVLSADENNTKALGNLGTALLQQGKILEALPFLKRAEQALTRISKKGGNDGEFWQLLEVYNNLGTAYLKQNNGEEAAKYYKLACDMNSTGACHKSLGQIYFSLNRWDECIREMAAALQYDKKDANVYGALGVAFNQKGDYNRAAGVFNEGLRYATDPKLAAQFHKNLGYLMMNQKQYAEAEKQFQFAVAKDWSSVDSHFGLAIAALSNNHPLTANESLRNVLQLNPQHQKAKEILSQMEASQQ